jgi:hypothetical protein
MTYRLVLTLLLALLLSPAYAQEADDQSADQTATEQQPQPDQDAAAAAVKAAPDASKTKLAKIPDYVPPKPVHYTRDQRLERALDPVIGYRNAENVVFLDVSYNDLPAFIRADVETVLGSCLKSTSGIKAYSYVSDWLRSRGLSQNYVLDFSGLATAAPSCASELACNDDGCMVMTYNSYSYGQWKRDAVIRNKSWTLGTLSDPRANAVPQSNKATQIAVFDFTAKCDALSKQQGDACHSYRMWSIGGLSTYTP